MTRRICIQCRGPMPLQHQSDYATTGIARPIRAVCSEACAEAYDNGPSDEKYMADRAKARRAAAAALGSSRSPAKAAAAKANGAKGGRPRTWCLVCDQRLAMHDAEDLAACKAKDE